MCEGITLDNQQIKVVSSVELLNLQLDDKLNFNLNVRGDTHMTSMKITQISKPITPHPSSLSIYVWNSSTPLTLDVQFQMNPPSPNDNQLIKRKHNPRMTSICYKFLLSGQLSFSICYKFLLSGQLSFSIWINLNSFPLTSFPLAEASLCYL